MKIIFICGCLEPGKDGVGDYTRKLGGELIRLGHQIYLLGLYDPYIYQIQEMIQESEGTNISVLRLNRGLPSKIIFSKAKEKIVQFAPTWVSLQYVPYSFHSKGLNFNFHVRISQLRGKFHWHLMIHEPWLTTSGFKISKTSLIGILQKRLLKMLVYKVDPKVIHTSNMYYKEILEKGGILSKLLHLPGNIPVKTGIEPEMIRIFEDLGICDNRADWIVLGTFGRMRSNMDYEIFIRNLLDEPDNKRKKIAFVSIGNVGIHCDAIFQRVKLVFKEKLLVHNIGERNPGQISSFFQLLDYGVASVPKHLLGKSGSYAAMREHGINVLIPEKKGIKGNFSKDEYSSDLLHLPAMDFSSENIARQFLCALNSSLDKVQNYSPVLP